MWGLKEESDVVEVDRMEGWMEVKKFDNVSGERVELLALQNFSDFSSELSTHTGESSA